MYSTGELRLSGTDKGRLDIFHNGEWGMICDDGFTSREAEVACRQMGFPDSKTVERTFKPSQREPALQKVIHNCDKFGSLMGVGCFLKSTYQFTSTY